MSDGLEPFAAVLRGVLADAAARGADLAGTVAALHAAGLTDGLPVIPPGTEAVAALLDGRNPLAAAIGSPLPIAFATPSWGDLATVAVLAGCPPEPALLDVVAAALDACADPAFNLLGVAATTGAASPLVVVHGGAARRLGLHAGAGGMGPGGHRNGPVGRAVRLALQNIGCARPGEADMATLGHPGKVSWLVAERVGAAPWPPLEPPDAVTVYPGVGNVEVVLPLTGPDAVADRLAAAIAGVAPAGAAVLVPPDAAVFLHRHGWDGAVLASEVAARGGGGPPWLVVSGGAGVKAAVVPRWGGPCAPVTRPIPWGGANP